MDVLLTGQVQQCLITHAPQAVTPSSSTPLRLKYACFFPSHRVFSVTRYSHSCEQQEHSCSTSHTKCESFAEHPALYDIPGAADEMPLPQSILGDPRGPGGRGLEGVPLLATTGNDMSSKESVDMPMQAMTHPLVEKASHSYSLLDVCQKLHGPTAQMSALEPQQAPA